MSIADFFSVLFDKDESTCFADTPKGTHIYWKGLVRPERDAFFSINPIDWAKDHNPTETWHHPQKPRRSDDNVVAFRNILIEIDNLPIEQQKAIIEAIALPYSTAVFSGSKSVHYIISLVTPLTNRSEYDRLVRRVYRAVGNVDPSCKNPSRLSRVPGHIRQDTGKIQELMYIATRIENEKLEAWLLERGVGPTEETVWEEVPRIGKQTQSFSSLTAATKNFLMIGAESGKWNLELFKAAADLCRNGWLFPEACTELMSVTGKLDKNDEKTINSAFKNEENQK